MFKRSGMAEKMREGVQHGHSDFFIESQGCSQDESQYSSPHNQAGFPCKAGPVLSPL